MDAIDISPARSEYVITVAASDIHDTKWIDSNYGGVVDIWAPGVNVISTWKDGGTQTMTGTSMAAAHVSGFAAYLLNLDNTLTPDRVAEFIKRKGLRQILNGVGEFFSPSTSCVWPPNAEVSVVRSRQYSQRVAQLLTVKQFSVFRLLHEHGIYPRLFYFPLLYPKTRKTNVKLPLTTAFLFLRAGQCELACELWNVFPNHGAGPNLIPSSAKYSTKPLGPLALEDIYGASRRCVAVVQRTMWGI